MRFDEFAEKYRRRWAGVLPHFQVGQWLVDNREGLERLLGAEAEVADLELVASGAISN